MPKYRIEYRLDVQTYGEVELDIEATDRDGFIQQVRALNEDHKIVANGWETVPEDEGDNHRVVQVLKRTDDGSAWERLEWQPFGLDEDEDYYEENNNPLLYVIWSDDCGRILGHSLDYDEAESLAAQMDDVRILKARL